MPPPIESLQKAKTSSFNRVNTLEDGTMFLQPREACNAPDKALIDAIPLLHEAYKTKEVICIGGMHRSGTTLIWQLLKAHQECSAFPKINVYRCEGQYEQTIYPNDVYYGDMAWPEHPEIRRLTATGPYNIPENGVKLFSQWGRLWDLNKRVMVEKTPRNLVMGTLLQALIPKTSLIYVVRHPVVQALAIQTQGWTKEPLDVLVDRWITAHTYMMQDLPSLYNTYVIRYEDFVTKPQDYLDYLCQSMRLTRHKIIRYIHPDTNDKYKEQYANLDQLPNKYESLLNLFGYTLKDLTTHTEKCIVPFTEL